MAPRGDPNRPGKARLLQCGAALALLPLLAGCFAAAAVAVPAITAAGLFASKQRVRAATPRPEPTALAAAATRAENVQLTTLTELPPPSGAPSAATADPAWRRFLSYAGERASALAADGPAESALLTREAAAGLRPLRRPCTERTPGILIDLDTGADAYGGQPGGRAPAALAAGLDRLRQAGVVVLWISRSSANRVAEIGDALFQAGLDPSGRDPLLLIRTDDQRKQTLREEANTDVCLIAIAGDERADFDELFDYLRDPAMAPMLDSLIGDGWFLVPPPMTPPLTAP